MTSTSSDHLDAARFRRRWLSAHLHESILIALALLVYGRAVGFDFLALDDELLILDNVKVHALSWSNVKQIFTTFDPELYIPLTLLSYQIEYALFGPDPAVFHAVNILLHAGNVLLVHAVFRRLLPSRGAFAAALLFAVHPLAVETVAWASARKDLLSAFFFLLSFRSYLHFRDEGRGWRRSILFFLLALLSKVSVFPLPFVLLLTDWMREGRFDRRRLRDLIPYVLLAAVFVIIAIVGKKTQVGSPLVPLLLAPAATLLTLRHVFLPIGLSIFYPFTDAVTLLHPRVLLGFAVCAAIAAVAIVSLRVSRKPLWAWLCFLFLLVPSFVNMQKGGVDGIVDIYLTSDRYAYLALLGPLALLGSLPGRRAFALLPVAALFAALSFRHLATWQSSTSLFANVVAVHKNSHVAYNNLAGLAVRSGALPEAAALYERSLAAKKNSKAYFNLAQVEAARGNTGRAFVLFEELLQFQPLFARGWAVAGHLYLEHENAQMAYVHLVRANEIDPGQSDVHFDLGLLYERAGKRDLALQEYATVLRLDPAHARAQHRKDALLQH